MFRISIFNVMGIALVLCGICTDGALVGGETKAEVPEVKTVSHIWKPRRTSRTHQHNETAPLQALKIVQHKVATDRTNPDFVSEASTLISINHSTLNSRKEMENGQMKEIESFRNDAGDGAEHMYETVTVEYLYEDKHMLERMNETLDEQAISHGTSTTEVITNHDYKQNLLQHNLFDLSRESNLDSEEFLIKSKRAIDKPNDFFGLNQNSIGEKKLFMDRPKKPKESSAERAERVQKGIHKLMHFVTIVGHVDSYLSKRFRSGVRKFAKLVEDSKEMPSDRRRRRYS